MIDTIVRIAICPLLAVQAISVRRQAKSLPEAAGPRQGKSGVGRLLKLKIIGDSSAAGVGVDHQDQALAGHLSHALATKFTVDWDLNAKTGATTHSTLERLSSAQNDPAQVVVVALGVNDVTRLVPAWLWVRRQHQLFARITSLYAPQRIYLSGLPPFSESPLLPNPLRWTLARHARRLERALRASLEGQGTITYVPFALEPDPTFLATDGFHPAEPLYEIWGKEMASRIISDWP